MYATNLDKFGRLLQTDNYRTNNLHNDLWEIFDNKVVSSYSATGIKSCAEDHENCCYTTETCYLLLSILFCKFL